MGTDDRLSLLVVDTGDAARLERLHASIRAFNVDDLAVQRVEATSDRDDVVLDTVVAAAGGAVLVLAADVVFIRPFVSSDFVAPDGRARVFLTEDRERLAAGTVDQSRIWSIRDTLGVTTGRVLVPGGPMVYDPAVAAAMVGTAGSATALMGGLVDAPTWYATWLVATLGEEIDFEEPVFCALRPGGVPGDFSLAGATLADLARGFVGVVGDLPEATSAEGALAGSIPAAELAAAASRGLLARAPRVQRALRRD